MDICFKMCIFTRKANTPAAFSKNVIEPVPLLLSTGCCSLYILQHYNYHFDRIVVFPAAQQKLEWLTFVSWTKPSWWRFQESEWERQYSHGSWWSPAALGTSRWWWCQCPTGSADRCRAESSAATRRDTNLSLLFTPSCVTSMCVRLWDLVVLLKAALERERTNAGIKPSTDFWNCLWKTVCFFQHFQLVSRKLKKNQTIWFKPRKKIEEDRNSLWAHSHLYYVLLAGFVLGRPFHRAAPQIDSELRFGLTAPKLERERERERERREKEEEKERPRQRQRERERERERESESERERERERERGERVRERGVRADGHTVLLSLPEPQLHLLPYKLFQLPSICYMQLYNSLFLIDGDVIVF